MSGSTKVVGSWLRLDDADNVVVATAEGGVTAGTRIDPGVGLPSFEMRKSVPKGHKIATRAIARGAPVVKFGHVIGVATSEIGPGDHVHVHNVAMPPPELTQSHTGAPRVARADWDEVPATFQGYARANGTAGVRNYVVVTASVNCSATVVKAICRHFLNRDLGGVDGVIPVSHSSGCAQAIGGLGYKVLNRTLAGWVFHPNVVGAVVIGLGCEGTTFKSILASEHAAGKGSSIPLEHFAIQDVGGTAEAIGQGIKAVQKILAGLPPLRRTELPVSKLSLALNCGGSDGLSGLTANPALGIASDMLVSKGGTVALAEIPECHGAEDLLVARSAGPDVTASLRRVFDWWQQYAKRHEVGLNENLAPGNIAGGITTIVEKSLGAVAKAGSTKLTQVVDYAEPITRSGFTLMNTPGFDPVSVTGLVAGGCNLVGFTTGRGSVYGCGIAPTIKIATNSELFRRMRGDMDVNAGDVLEEGVETVARTLYRFMIEVANGKQSASEALGLGWEEFAPWPVGETL